MKRSRGIVRHENGMDYVQGEVRERVAETRKEARARGLQFYLGRACKRGHSGVRYASDGGCIACRHEGDRRRRHPHFLEHGRPALAVYDEIKNQPVYMHY